MENTPKISVIIPVYNAEKFIRRCLNSILRQPISLEIICVDDCSTDNTPAILEEYAKKHKNVHVYRNEKNLYAGLSRNVGISHAKGEYLHFMDSDDFALPNTYPYLYKVAHKNDLDMLKTRCVCFDQRYHLPSRHQVYSFKLFDSSLYNKVLKFSEQPKQLYYINVVPWNGIYKRSFVLENNLQFNNLFCANDRSFFVHALITAKRVMITKKFFVMHRKNNGTSLVDKRAQHFDCDMESFNIAYSLCEKYKLEGEERFQVLEHEMNNIMAWYRKFMNKGTLSEDYQEALGKMATDKFAPYFPQFGERSQWGDIDLLLGGYPLKGFNK